LPRREVTLAEKNAILNKKRSNTGYHQLTEITGVPKSTIACVIQQQEKLRDEWKLCHRQQGISQKWKHTCKDPDVEEVLSQWISVITEQSVHDKVYNVEKQVRGMN
jgi:hypothetical protein